MEILIKSASMEDASGLLDLQRLAYKVKLNSTLTLPLNL